MTVIVTLAFVFAMAALVVTHIQTQKRLEGLVRDMVLADQERQMVLYKQHKANARQVASAERAVLKLSDKVNALADESRALNERTDRHFAHPNVKRFLDG